MSGNGRQEERLAVRRALFERLDWQVAERDDAAVARSVYNCEELGSIYNLDQGGLLDGFMAFLGDIGFLEHLSGHAPEHCQRGIR